MNSTKTAFYSVFFLIVSVFFLGCASREVNASKEVEELNRQLAILLGDLDRTRAKITDLRQKIEASSPAELNDLILEREKLSDSLPVLAGIEVSQEFAELDWLAGLKRAITLEPTPISLLEAEMLLAEVPVALKSTAPRWAEQHASQVIQTAKAYLKSESIKIDDLETLSKLLQRLAPMEGSPSDELASLRDELQAKLKSKTIEQLVNDAKSEASLIEEQLNHISKVKDAAVRRAGFAVLSQAVDATRIRLAIDGVVDAEAVFADLKTKIDAKLVEAIELLGKEQEKILDNARMRYQAWALEQIEQMNLVLKEEAINSELYFLRDSAAKSQSPVVVELARYEGVRKRLEEKLGALNDNLTLSAEQQAGIRDFVKENWYPLVYQAKHDAAKKYLLPVNQALLEPPVAKFYSESFEAVWQQIQDGDGMQLSLAQKTAEVPKRSLESFMENNK